MNAIFQLLNPTNTVMVNRALAHAVGLNEAVLYAAIISKYYRYEQTGKLNDGWFYSTVPDLEESTALTEKQQKRAITNLANAGLIKCELRGMPAKRSFFVIEDVELLRQILSSGEEKIQKIKPSAAEKYERKRQENTPSTLLNFLEESLNGTSSVCAK